MLKIAYVWVRLLKWKASETMQFSKENRGFLGGKVAGPTRLELTPPRA